MQKNFVKSAIIVLFLILIGGGFFLSTRKRNDLTLIPTITPTTYPTDPTTDWKIYTSTVFDYSFKYPAAWSILMFNENDPNVLYGSHSLQNYSPTEVEKYMDHGIIDWVGFIKNKPAIKIDFAVHSTKPGPNQYKNKEEFLDTLLNETSTKTEESDLNIGNYPTEQYKATENLGPTDVPEINTYVAYPDDNRIIFMNLIFWNIKSYESLKNTLEWQELSQILASFKFTE